MTEQMRAIEVPLRRPERLQNAAGREHETILRCAGLAPARVWCPPFFLRPAYASLVPDIPPSTLEIAIRYRMRGNAVEKSPTETPGMACGGPTHNRPADTIVPPAARTASDDADLARFVSAAIDADVRGDGLRVVRRGNRLVELRIRSEVAFRLLGGGERAQAVVRRWAARRWIKQVRPAFVLERAALETLDPTIQQRLSVRA